MPRTQTLPQPRAITSAPSALIASATRYPGNAVKVYTGSQEWQKEAWRFYDITGELRFASNWIANALSRSKLLPAKRDGLGNIFNTPSPKAASALAAMFDGAHGQTSMLSSLGLHLTVAGEAYVIGRRMADPNTGVETELWEVVGVQEIRNRGSRWSLTYGPGGKATELDDDAVIIRIWRPHPRNRMEADSPVRALLPILTELEYLTRHVFAQVQSRLAGAGLLLLPQEITFPAGDGTESLNIADALMNVLGEAMLTPIKDPGNPSALVPLLLTIPGEFLGKSEFIKFWTDLDAQAISMRDEAIRRFALGMDVPPEIVLGQTSTAGGSSNHWTAWQIEETSIKLHVEPLLQIICDGLTAGYLAPATGDITDCVTFDTTALKIRPDRSQPAMELYDRGELSAEATRRENGFEEDDAPTDEDLRKWLLKKIASGSSTPDQVSSAAQQLGVQVPSDTGQVGRESVPTPSLKEHEQRSLPEQAVASLTATADALVFRALERAGNRLRSNLSVKPKCQASDTYLHCTTAGASMDYLLADAWSCLPRLIEQTGFDPIAITAALDAYTRDLLISQLPHDRNRMAKYLPLVGI